MSLLIVMAHFDVDGVLRPHARRTIDEYARAADQVVVVSTSGVEESSLDRLGPNVRFITRPNFGYDFYSYKWGLDSVGEYADFDRILITNDSFVGPTVPIDVILDSDACKSVDVMGMTVSKGVAPHAQSFFITVNGFVARSTAFRRFWKDMVPLSDRMKVILNYEIGFSARLVESGFRMGGYFLPTEEEAQLAKERYRHHGSVRLHSTGGQRVVSEIAEWDESHLSKFNPAIALADRVLVHNRLPLVKFDTLRYDPYELGAGHLLKRCEDVLPEYFGGVRRFLRETNTHYPFRRGESNLAVSPRQLRDSGLGYCHDAAFSGMDGELAK